MLHDYKHLTSLFFNKGMPTYIVYHITSKCDSRCKMCFNWKNLNKTREEELELWEIEKLSKSFNKLVYVSLGGGEPFLRKDINEIAATFYKNNDAAIFQAATNCLHPQQIAEQCRLILEKCPKAQLKVTLSLDGIGKDHDNIRGVKGNFKKFLETYGLLSRIRAENRRFDIFVNTVYSKYTWKKARRIYQWVKDNLDVDVHGFTFVRGNTKEKNAKNVPIDEYEAFVAYINSEYRKRKFRSGAFKKVLPALSILTRKQVIRELRGKKRIFRCRGGRRLLHIDPFGNVFACEYLPIKLGNIRNYGYDVKRILSLEKTQEVLRMIDAKDCSCTWECAIKHGIAYDWKMWGRVLREVVMFK